MRKPYPSDPTNARWKLIRPLIRPVEPGGRPRQSDVRAAVDGRPHVDAGGCRWRAGPRDRPHWKTG